MWLARDGTTFFFVAAFFWRWYGDTEDGTVNRHPSLVQLSSEGGTVTNAIERRSRPAEVTGHTALHISSHSVTGNTALSVTLCDTVQHCEGGHNALHLSSRFAREPAKLRPGRLTRYLGSAYLRVGRGF